MKRIIAFCFIVLFISKISSAQSFSGSIIAGINSSQVSGDQLSGFNKAGVIIGGGVSLPLSKKFEAGFEIIFIQKGSKKNADNENGDYSSYKMSLNYIEVPVMFEYKAAKRLRLHAGPTLGVLLSSKEENQDGELPDQPAFEKYEIGIAGGLSFYITPQFSLNLRLSNSVLPIRKVGVDYGNTVSGQYNSGLAFTLKYTFASKKETAQ